MVVSGLIDSLLGFTHQNRTSTQRYSGIRVDSKSEWVSKFNGFLHLGVGRSCKQAERRPSAAESISRKDPQKLPSNFFSLKSLYHPGVCLWTTRDHSRAPGAPGGHSKCTCFAFFGPGRAIIRSRAAKTLDSNSDTTALRPLFVSSEYG